MSEEFTQVEDKEDQNGSRPFWSDLCLQNSNKLWLPTIETKPSSLATELSTKMIHSSWFNTVEWWTAKRSTHKVVNTQPCHKPKDTVVKVVKIRLFPDSQQRQVFKR
jgi:hypothetical protein